MDEEKKEDVIISDEGEKAPEEQKPEENKTPEENAEDFEKDSEVVSAGKYNQAIRKAREVELEKRELEKRLAEAETKVPTKDDPEEDEDEEEDEDFFKDDKPKKDSPDISSLIDEKVKPVIERLNQKEAEDRKNQRTAFFKAYPKYLKAENWQDFSTRWITLLTQILKILIINSW